jgi:hypothetical protein
MQIKYIWKLHGIGIWASTHLMAIITRPAESSIKVGKIEFLPIRSGCWHGRGLGSDGIDIGRQNSPDLSGPIAR